MSASRFPAVMLPETPRRPGLEAFEWPKPSKVGAAQAFAPWHGPKPSKVGTRERANPPFAPAGSTLRLKPDTGGGRNRTRCYIPGGAGPMGCDDGLAALALGCPGLFARMRILASATSRAGGVVWLPPVLPAFTACRSYALLCSSQPHIANKASPTRWC